MVIVDPKYATSTQRLVLRPLRIEDAKDVVLMRKNPEVMKHTNGFVGGTSCLHSRHERDNNWNFAVELKSPSPTPPRVIGLIGAVRVPEVGYMFNSSYWGQGYATEALSAFMPLFFAHYFGEEHERHDYAVALTDTELLSSQNVLSKVGFRLHEKREKDFENPVLGVRDTLVYRMARPDDIGRDAGEVASERV
ncbi:GNAT domain-containing protein [Phaeosphaeriaceae sp. PMI808]|nr:GNAT domain-containing protein [Phaeosphaeriaceae sp. PMI808]